MAIVVHTGSDLKFGFFEQTTWGTAIEAADAVTFLDIDPVVIVPPFNLHESNSVHVSRDLDETSISADVYGLTPEITLSGVADKLLLPFLLYLYFQNVAEGATESVFNKIFTFLSTQPDFTADAGCFISLVLANPDDSTDKMIKDLIAKDIELTCDPAGRLMFNASLIGRGAADIVFNSTGTWTTNTPSHFRFENQAIHTLDFAGSPQTLTLTGGWSLKLSQDVIPVGQDGSGEIATFGIDNRRGLFSGNVLWDAHARSAEADMVAGNFAELQIGWDGDADGDCVGDADGDILIDYHGHFTKVEQNTESPAGVSFEMAMNRRIATTAIEPCTIAAADGVDHTWPE